MRKRELGKSKIQVSELGLGCMSLPTERNEAKMIVESALDAGITFFDTADLYDGGVNEELVGNALKGHRNEIILATKVGNKMNPDGKTWHWDPSKEHIMEGVKSSLQRLGTDYIDLYQLHGGTMEDQPDETIEAFERLKEEGIIRQYGISSIRPNVIEQFLAKSDIVSIMMQYSMLDRRPEEWFTSISEQGASVIARGPLAKGLLTAEAKQRVLRSEGFVGYSQPELQTVISKLTKEVSNIHAAAIHFCLQKQTVATSLVGARTLEQLTDSIHAYETAISSTELQNLEEILSVDFYEQHRN